MIEVDNVRKAFRSGDREVEALRGVSCRIPRGRCAFIVGPSGSGKSTLLYLLGALDRPSSGTIWVNRRELTLWSFLMSSAHGAGLMVAPVLLAGATLDAGSADHAMHASIFDLSMPATALALAVHVAGMVVTMGIVAVLVYDRFATSILRRTWLNLDRVWAGAFIVAGAFTLVS